MIDIENYVVTQLSNAILARYPKASVRGDTTEEFAVFPAVTINEIGNATLKRMQDDELTEHYVTVTYEVNIYCNDVSGRKQTCKKILDIVNATMLGMKFTKLLVRRLPNIDRSIYRMYARYQAVIDEGTVDGDGNITYHVYRG